MNSLTMRFSLVAVLSVLLALALAVTLNFFMFHQTMTRVTEQRISFFVQSLASSVQTGLDLGLELSTIENVAPLLERSAAIDPGIAEIWVVDAAGSVVHASADAGAPPVIETSEEVQRIETGTDITLIAPLRSEIGQVIGALALRYDTARMSASTGNLLSGVISTSGLILLIAAGVTIPLIHFACRRIERRLLGLETALNAEDAPEAVDADLGALARTARVQISAAEASLRSSS